jgi:Flp pilus assembly protein TadG
MPALPVRLAYSSVRGRGKRRGVVYAWLIIGLPAFMGVCALALDTSSLIIAKSQLQAAADAAALAGAGVWRDSADASAASTAAVNYAATNYVLGKSIALNPTTDVTVGSWNATTRTIGAWSPTSLTLAVQVRARRTTGSAGGQVPLFFAPLLGIKGANVSAKSTAIVARTIHQRAPVEFAIAQDATGSFAQEWSNAMDGDWSLVNLVNPVAMAGDRSAFVAFNDAIKTKKVGKVNQPLTMNLTNFHDYSQPLPTDGSAPALTASINTSYTFFRSDTPSGYTDPSVALSWAVDEYAAHGASGAQKVIVLVSDGMPYGPTDYQTQQRRNNTIAQANRAAAAGIRIHTVTLSYDTGASDYGMSGADFAFNASLVRNGGRALVTNDAAKLRDLMIAVGSIECGSPCLAD